MQPPGPAGAQCPRGRKSQLPNSCPQQLPGPQTPKPPKNRGAQQQGKGVGGLFVTPVSSRARGWEKGSKSCGWWYLGVRTFNFCSSARGSKSIKIWIWFCSCGQDGPGLLGYFLSVSRGIMDPVVASTPMLTGTSCVIFEPVPDPRMLHFLGTSCVIF